MTQPPFFPIEPGDRPVSSGRPTPERKRRRLTWPRLSLSRTVLSIALSVIAVGVLAAGILGLWVVTTLPDVTELARTVRHPSVTLQTSDGALIATYGDLYGETMTLAALPKALPEAVIATEDRRFYSHFGVDPLGLMRAALVNLRAGGVVQGGSTITQQLAKNVFLNPDRTIVRKLQEVALALWLEHRFTKDQLLEIYLNRVYFGAGAYGVDAASRRYFGRSARDLSNFECALLAGLLKAPSKYSPAGNQKRATARANQVLQNMIQAGYLTKEQAAAASRQSTVLASVPVTRSGMRYFADWIEDQVASSGYGGDVVVTTTIDPKLQEQAEQILAQSLTRDGTKAAVSQAALVAMAPDGAVRAMVGGRDYGESQFNRATQANRQPGSAFKPFVYLTALEQGMTPDDRFTDTPIRIGKWEPHNFSGSYQGDVSMADAVAESINTVAVRVAQRTGIRPIIATARRLGVTGTLPKDASIALGTGEVTLIDLVTSYCAFASGGMGAWPYGIVAIRDADGKILYQPQGAGPGRVIDPHYASEMNMMLEGVINHGTGRAAQLGRWAAGKSGTTSDFRDALFVGYTPDLVTGVWFGNDDNTPMNHVTGGSLPARAWHDFMIAALKNVPPHDMPEVAESPIVETTTDRTDTTAAADAREQQVAPSDQQEFDALLNKVQMENVDRSQDLDNPPSSPDTDPAGHVLVAPQPYR